MSILLADGSPAVPIPPHSLTVQPAPVVAPTTSSSDAPLPPAVTAVLIGWLVAAVIALSLLRVFRRRSIDGPVRLGPQQSAYSLLLVFFLGCGAMFLALYLVRFAGLHSFTATLLSGSLAELVGCGVMVALIASDGAAGQMGVAAAQVPRGLLVGAAAMLIVFPIVAAASQATMLALHWAGKAPPPPHPVLESLGESHDKFAIAVDVITAVVFAPLAEELAFRGVLQTVLGRMFGWLLDPRPLDTPLSEQRDTVLARWLAVLLTAGCFAAVHGVVAFVPPLFVLAVCLGYVYERTGNLWCTVTMHALFNGFEIALFLSPLSH